MEKEKVCRFGHQCTSDCQNTKDCPCVEEHCCALSEDVCDRTCDDCFFKEEVKCKICEDTGEVTKTEWTGTDSSHDITSKCICQEE